jgi:hypothetical protein
MLTREEQVKFLTEYEGNRIKYINNGIQSAILKREYSVEFPNIYFLVDEFPDSEDSFEDNVYMWIEACYGDFLITYLPVQEKSHSTFRGQIVKSVPCLVISWGQKPSDAKIRQWYADHHSPTKCLQRKYIAASENMIAVKQNRLKKEANELMLDIQKMKKR